MNACLEVVGGCKERRKGTFCLQVWESVVWAPCWGRVRGGGGGGHCYSRLLVNKARGECFMARAGL